MNHRIPFHVGVTAFDSPGFLAIILFERHTSEGSSEQTTCTLLPTSLNLYRLIAIKNHSATFFLKT